MLSGRRRQKHFGLHVLAALMRSFSHEVRPAPHLFSVALSKGAPGGRCQEHLTFAHKHPRRMLLNSHERRSDSNELRTFTALSGAARTPASAANTRAGEYEVR